VSAGDQVAVPAQHGFGAHEQPDAAQYLAGKTVQQRGEQCPVGRREPRPLAVQLPFEYGELMPEGQDFGVFGPVAQRQQPQHRQALVTPRYASRSSTARSSPSDHRRSVAARRGQPRRDPVTWPKAGVTRADEVSGTRSATSGLVQCRAISCRCQRSRVAGVTNRPARAGQQPRQGGQHHPVGRLEIGAGYLPA